MDLFNLIATIAFAGLVVWGVTTLIPMPPEFKKAIYVIAVIALALRVLTILGLFAHGQVP